MPAVSPMDELALPLRAQTVGPHERPGAMSSNVDVPRLERMAQPPAAVAAATSLECRLDVHAVLADRGRLRLTLARGIKARPAHL
jgi:hypothetical protein